MTVLSPRRPAKGFGFMGISVVTTTLPTAEDAQRMASGAVQARLAACVQVDAITSHYVWEGALEELREWRLVLKTVPDAVQPLVEWLRSQHPYELPQILLRGEQAQRDYGQWVAQNVQLPVEAPVSLRKA
ncbi:divalent-cation tolerance protein CutA [Comamonas sp. GB3 AK4-5]|uniref:divalent-cation tolerance protein CutA n=1 Tax=Comamonas sp. GB3 AK4-5 TaxID=3231487 RepID=UPI00351E768A